MFHKFDRFALLTIVVLKILIRNNLSLNNLLYCLKTSIFSGGENDVFSEMSSGDKELVCQTAEKYYLGRFLFFYYRNSLPELWRQKFSKEFLNASAVELKRSVELSKILKFMENNGFFVAPLKGVYLTYKAYPHPGLRLMGDIDLLIQKHEIENIYHLLKIDGYKQSGDIPHKFHKTALISKSGISIELHHHIMENQEKLTTDLLWKNSYPDIILGQRIISLSPEIHILHTIKHFFIDRVVSGFKNLIDVAYLISKFNPSPPKLYNFATQAGLDSHLRIFFNAFPEFFPTEFTYTLSDDDIKAVESTRFLITNYDIINKTTIQERGFESDFSGSTILGKLKFIIKAAFKHPRVIAFKYNCNYKNPEIVYYYFRSIYDGFKIFLKLLKKKEVNIKSKIGESQKKLDKFRDN
mgnify:CR=1 FL=1